MKSVLILIIFLTYHAVSAQNINPVWMVSETTTSGSNSFVPKVLVDSFHNPIVFGSIYAPGPATGFLTTKYDQNGNKLWERRHQTPASDFLQAAVVDKEGSVYVGGVTINDPFGAAGNQIVIKYSAEGDTLWQYYPQMEQGVPVDISHLMLDESENIMIFGSYVDTLQDRGGMFVQKKAPDGTLIWTAAHLENIDHFGGYDVRWIGDRWVFWGRNGNSDGDGYRLLSWQIDPNGETLGAALSESYPDAMYGLHTDGKGSIYMTQGYTYKIVKYDIAANKQWEYSKPVTPYPQFVERAIIHALTTDKDLNVYATGYIRFDSVHLKKIDALTVKLNASGDSLWEHHLTLPGSSYNLVATRFIWLNDSLLLTSGEVSSNNLTDGFFTIYNANGFVNSWVSDIAGDRNRKNSLALDGDYFYTTGITSDGFPLPTKQFLCKYALNDLVSSTSTQEVVTAGKMSIQPNPFSDHCTLFIDHTGSARSGSIRFCNMQGAVVFSREISLTQGVQVLELEPFGQLPNGMYQVILATDRQLYVAKAVKLR